MDVLILCQDCHRDKGPSFFVDSEQCDVNKFHSASLHVLHRYSQAIPNHTFPLSKSSGRKRENMI